MPTKRPKPTFNPGIIGEPTPGISLPIDPRPTGFYATYGETVGDAETASYDTGEITLSDDYAEIKGNTIWRDTLAASGLGLTAEEIDSLKLTDEELLTLGLTDEELLALRLQNEVYSMKNTSDGKASDDTDGDDIPSVRASVIITMDDELDGRTESELVTRYTYDSFDRLLRYSDHDGSTCYSYNADGYRTAKYDYDDSAEGIRYLSIGGRNLFETSCAGNFTALNTYGTTLTSRASLEGGYEYRNIVYLYSAYGDVVLVADAQTGMKLDSYAYDPFGNAILAGTPDTSVEISESSDITVTSGTESSASIDNPYGYRGYVKDDESGLYYLNARYYDSTSGRFLTADTFRGSKDDPLSLNRYVYCQSNPVRYTDPSGHFIDPITAFILSALIGTSVVDGAVAAKEKYDEGGSFGEIAEAFTYGGFEGLCKGYIALEINASIFSVGDLFSGRKSSNSNGFDEAMGYDNSSSDLSQGVNRGNLIGSLDKLTQDERIMVDNLLDQGKNVEIIPRSEIPNVKTPDFRIDGVLTELKTLNGTSVNTPVTRIQDAFNQGASTVIIDGRKIGFTIEQANTVLERITGIYKGNIPGKIEIWTKNGVVYGGK